MPDMPTTPSLSSETHGTPPHEKARNSPFNPLQPEILASAPRCGARARTRGGAPCRSPAVRGGARCRMHGGKGSGAPRGNRNGWKHGAFSAPMKDIARYLRATAMIVKLANATLRSARYAPFPSAIGWAISRRPDSSACLCEAEALLRQRPAGPDIAATGGAMSRRMDSFAAPDIAATNQPILAPMGIDLGEQPHAPGNSAERTRVIAAVGPVARPREAGASPPPRRVVRPAGRPVIAAAEKDRFRMAAWSRPRHGPIPAKHVGPKSQAPPPMPKKMPRWDGRRLPSA